MSIRHAGWTYYFSHAWHGSIVDSRILTHTKSYTPMRLKMRCSLIRPFMTPG